MAIITCSDCNKEMSDAATACPHCGKPNNKISGSRSVGLLLWIGILLLPIVFVWFTLRKGHSTKSRIISFGWLILSLIIVTSGDKTKTNTAQNASAPTSASRAIETKKAEVPLLDVTADELATSYSENTVAADQQFKGKRYRVSGTVTDINTDILGDPYVTMEGGPNPFLQPQFKFEKSESGKLARLKKGSNVVLVCVGGGDIAKMPMSKSCILQ